MTERKRYWFKAQVKQHDKKTLKRIFYEKKVRDHVWSKDSSQL